MKIATIIVRTLLGLMFVFASVVVLFKLVQEPELKGAAKTYMDGMKAAPYFIPLLKITELVCGLAFLIGRFVPLATVVIFPITLNIMLYHLFVAPEGIVVGVSLMLANLFLAYACRKHYVTLVAAK